MLFDSNKIWIIWFLVFAVILCHLILFFVGCGDQELGMVVPVLGQSTGTHSLFSGEELEKVMSPSPLSNTPSSNLI